MWTETATLEEYRLIVDTNLTSVFLLTQRVGKEMLARGWGRSNRPFPVSTSPRMEYSIAIRGGPVEPRSQKNR